MQSQNFCEGLKVNLNQNFRISLLGYKDKAAIKKLLENSQGWQKDGILLPGGHLPPPCHPMATGLGTIKLFARNSLSATARLFVLVPYCSNYMFTLK